MFAGVETMDYRFSFAAVAAGALGRLLRECCVSPVVHGNGSVIDTPEESRLFAGSQTLPHLSPIWLKACRDKTRPFLSERPGERKARMHQVAPLLGRIIEQRAPCVPGPSSRIEGQSGKRSQVLPAASRLGLRCKYEGDDTEPVDATMNHLLVIVVGR